MTEHPAPDLGAFFRNLAREVHKCETDEDALKLMRRVTGLSMTDPEADRAEIDRRVAAARGAPRVCRYPECECDMDYPCGEPRPMNDR